nr:hypothetical protein BEI47_03215 [Aliivibrio fischeri]
MWEQCGYKAPDNFVVPAGNGSLLAGAYIGFSELLKGGEISQQTRRVLDNLNTILEEAGSDLQQVLKLVIYISDIDMWDTVNDICKEYFVAHKPVRTIVPTRELHFGLKIEVDCIAICE